MRLRKIILTLTILILVRIGFAQVGSLRDPTFIGMDSRLIALEFNGKIYAPRHGSLPTMDYINKVKNSRNQVIMEALIRPVELFTSNDSGLKWDIACQVPIFTSLSIGPMKVQLDIYAETSIMKKISATHFVLATQFSVTESGGNKKYVPVIFLFKEDLRPDHLPIYLEAVFRPGPLDKNRVIDIKTVGNATAFELAQNGTETFTVNPDSENEWMFKDSFGGFSGQAKRK